MELMVSWQMFAPNKPLKLVKNPIPTLENGEVLVKIAGCGVCHTDLGFYYNGVKTKSSNPLTLGHEISGVVIETGNNVFNWIGKSVIIPAVISCGHCDVCTRGLGNICFSQKMLGNDINGGFSSHVVVPAHQLCEVPVDSNYKPISKKDISLAELSVIADALTTPYQAIIDSGLGPEDTAIFVGVGGVGCFGAQIAKAKGSCVIAIDIDERKLNLIAPYVDITFNSAQLSFKELRKSISTFVKSKERRITEWKIFETSGTPSGQKIAFGLLNFGSYLSVIGFTMKTLDIRLSNLMAFHSTAKGNWGCLASHYPDALKLVLSGQVDIKPFVKIFPLSDINSVFNQVHMHKNEYRAIMVP